MKNKLVVVAGGTGKLGRLVTQALLDHPNTNVRVLSRDPSAVPGLARDRVELHAFDPATATDDERRRAVAGAFAVVSTLQGGPDVIVGAQLALLRAAKAEGARRFLPSDYSLDFFEVPEGVNLACDWRRTLANSARAEATSEFEVVHVLQGMFADASVLGFLGLFDPDAGVVRYWGEGTTPIDWTTWEDTARFIAAAALDDDAVPARLFVSGDRMDLLTFAKTWERIRGRPLALERLGSLDELAAETKRSIAENPRNMMAWLPLMYARAIFEGRGLLGPTHNARYPSIEPINVAAVIARGEL